MLGIGTKLVSHCLAIHLSTIPGVQRNQKIGEENKVAIDEEVEKIFDDGFIIEAKYPTWLANLVLV